MIERIRSAISRAPIAAVVVAVLAGYLAARFFPSPRYTVSTDSVSNAVFAYVIDNWTGRLRFYILGDEHQVRSVEDQEREKLKERAKRKARILERAARTKTEDGKPAVRCFQTSSRYTSNVVPIDYLDDYLEEHPDAVPAGPSD